MEEKREQKLDIGVISINESGLVNIELLLDRELFSEIEMMALQNICDQLQVLMMEISKKIDEKIAGADEPKEGE